MTQKEFTNDFSEEVWSTTYKDHKDETVKDTINRVASAIASVEMPDKIELYTKEFESLLSGFKVTSGGRIYSNAGTDWLGTTLMNCFVGPKPQYDQDSLDGILSVLRSQAQTLKSEGGWGMNFSFIRPRGSFIGGIGVESPGSVKYAELFDKSSDVITSGSGKKANSKKAKGKIRKGAMMGVLDVWHPDIEEFITAKLTPNRLSKFNLSVNCSNEFMDRVSAIKDLKAEIENGKDKYTKEEAEELVARHAALDTWDLIFPDTKHPQYKEEWTGNISAWKAKGYPVIVHKTVTVSYLWDLIMRSTYERNDPGVLFLDRANQTHCWYYGGDECHIAATNPCGEQCLPFGAVCNLASLNLTQFFDKNMRGVNWLALAHHTRMAVRFLDNVNTYTNAPLPEYMVSIKERRRIGLGVMGWGSLLYMMKIRFGSEAAESLKKGIMRVITHNAVEESINLAEEKGMFGGCDPEKHAAAPFWKQIDLPENLLERMRKVGIRNSALFSIQPTGNTSIFANLVSGGLEPVFLHEYIRTSIVNTPPENLLEKNLLPKYWEGQFHETEMFKYTNEGSDKILKGVCPDTGIVYKIDKNRGLTKETLCEDYGVHFLKELGEWEPKADWAVTANDLSVEDHLTDMKGFGIWIDSSMSKTINIPNDYPYEDFKNVYLNGYNSGYLKGVTTYRAGTMATVLSSTEKKEETQTIPKSVPPKRPKELDGELHHFKISNHKYYVAVGLMNGDPYEIFTGTNDKKKDEIPREVRKGKIRKEARGKYTFIASEEEDYSLTNGHSDDTADALTRIISTALRHGAEVNFIVHQLEKTEGPLVSFGKAIARTLKKYIKDGTKVSGECCSSCNSPNLERREGCVTCRDCGSSKCG